MLLIFFFALPEKIFTKEAKAGSIANTGNGLIQLFYEISAILEYRLPNQISWLQITVA